jgi:amino acid transporter
MIIGVKESTLLNKIFTAVNILIMAFMIIAGATQANIAYWKVDTTNLTWTDIHGKNHSCTESARCGTGGFFPFGVKGVIDGAAKCFYAFVGFDVIASTGEEVVNPKRNIPLAILYTLIIISVLYCGLAAVLTLMIPYYLLDADAALAHAFEYAGMDWAKYLVTTGAALTLATWYVQTVLFKYNI